MKKHFINNNSENLLIFFTGWGCDEHEFEHLKSNENLLILYDYDNKNINFDFSNYKQIDLIAFSAGVFMASIFDFTDIKLNKKIAISGNPYLFDEYFGLSKNIQNILYNVTEDTAEVFAKNYLVKTDEEYQNFHNSKRDLDSCKKEFTTLKLLYEKEKTNIKNIFETAIIGDEDPIFNVATQKEYYGDKLHIIENARHNIFFRLKNYEQILNIK